jgi:nucleotide-binding universal stress UspA family protein
VAPALATAQDDVAETILDLATEVKARLLIIGARRRSPVGKALLGSVAQALILEADVPVLVVKAPS